VPSEAVMTEGESLEEVSTLYIERVFDVESAFRPGW
jgi:hypothetical protein